MIEYNKRHIIHLCQTCGWRINQRYNRTIAQEDVGKHLLYNHMAFCSEYCIEKAKEDPRILNLYIMPTDWNEQGWTENGVYSNWKIERKLNRSKRVKNRKLLLQTK